MLIPRPLTVLVSLPLALFACSSFEPTTDGTVGATGGGSSPGSGGGQTTTGGSDTGSGGVESLGGVGTGGDVDNGGAAGGTSGAGGSAGGVGVGPSDLPPAPGEGDVPIPTGTPGDLTVLDWAGFPAAVTYSFDDNDGSQLAYYDEMRALGGRYTFYLMSEGFGTPISDPGWQKIAGDGNEIGNHTTNHSCGEQNIDGANVALESQFGKKPSTLAAPNGDPACTAQAPGRVMLNRGVGPAAPVTPLDGSDPFSLNCYIPQTNQAADQYNENIDDALGQNGWVIYVIHGIQPTSHTYMPVSWEGLKGAIEYAVSKDVWIDTMENIGSYWLGQKAFADAMTSTVGASVTWTWTLPDQFPQGKYLRVTVEGGTLSQEGASLTWDPHGYYEVALDAGSVTLAP